MSAARSYACIFLQHPFFSWSVVSPPTCELEPTISVFKDHIRRTNRTDPELFGTAQLTTFDKSAATEFCAYGLSAEDTSFMETVSGIAEPVEIDIAT